MQIAVIGAGAAGCFAAIELKRRLPDAEITVYEAQNRALAKVAITGGGRCNLTNSFAEVKSAETIYPRGARLMKRLLREFSHRDAWQWFENEGVRLTTQSDECVFPVSQNAMEIVNTLLNLMERLGVKLKTHCRIQRIEPDAEHSATMPRYNIAFSQAGKMHNITADAVVITTGGSPQIKGLDFLQPLHLEIIPPVPSLFSFCIPNTQLKELMGTVVENATTTLCGTKLKAGGPLLITHWGLSGPAVLKLSAHGARLLAERNYQAQIAVNWMGGLKENEVKDLLIDLAQQHSSKQLQSVYPEVLNARLWHFLLAEAGLDPTRRWAGMNDKSLSRLAAKLTNHQLPVEGKNRFKEEFVTCGGVALSNINPSTLEARQYPNMYFAGEVLDIDAVTGGFNLQAAWTTGFVAAKALSGKSEW